MFRNLSLFKHLLLAFVPGVVIAVPIIIAYVSDSYQNPLSELTAAVVFCALFGGLVMAPFITSRSGVAQRASVLIVVAVFIFNLLNAVLLAIVAPLSTSRRFWGFVGLTGTVTGVLCAVLFHYFFCIIWCDWTVLLMGVLLFVWPLLFCTSVYLWRTQPGAKQPVDTES